MRSSLIDFDVSMFHNHEGAEIRVHSSVGGTRIGNQVSTVVDVRDCRSARLVCPQPIPTFSKPMEVPVWCNHQSYQMSLGRTFVVCPRCILERICHCRG